MIARDCADGGDQSERINTPTEEVSDLLADSADEDEVPREQRVKSTSLRRGGRPGSRGSWNAEKETGTSTSGRAPDLATLLAEAGRADPRRSAPQAQTGIKVDNVPAELSMDDLHDTFGDVGSVKHLERHGRSVRVWFASESEAARATTTFHGGELNGAKISAISLVQDLRGEDLPAAQEARPKQERLVRTGPWSNQLVTETGLKQRLETKSALEWGVTTREPSKKELREWENEQATGGLRNPWVAVSRNYGLRRLGLRVRQAFDHLVLKHPQALDVADTFGTENCTEPPEEIIEDYRNLSLIHI